MSALLIACSDGGIATALDALQRRLGLEDADRMLVPGGPLVLTRPGMERRVAVQCVEGLVEAHDTRTIVLVAHQDCSAYERALGGLGFDQQELLERDLLRVKMLLENDYPRIDVRCFLIPWHENAEGAGFGEAEPVE
jgi:hypothetical protein